MPAIPEEIEESERKESEENDCPMCAKLIRSKCLLCKIDVTEEDSVSVESEVHEVGLAGVVKGNIMSYYDRAGDIIVEEIVEEVK